MVKWAYGVTTVLSRKDDLLVKTLNSLCDAGFGDPHLFVDGCDDPSPYHQFAGLVTCRPNPPLSVTGNWVLALWELYIRNPAADRYALFQDDIGAVLNLRKYLDTCTIPEKGYWNLFTNLVNHNYTNGEPGWQVALQKGLGALGLVFTRDGVQTLLGSPILISKPAFASKRRALRSIDGGICESMKRLGWKEYVHNPSLLQHWGGTASSLGHVERYRPAKDFPGEDYDISATT